MGDYNARFYRPDESEVRDLFIGNKYNYRGTIGRNDGGTGIPYDSKRHSMLDVPKGNDVYI